MMSISWQVDEKTKVFWQADWAGMETVLVNEMEVYRARSFKTKNNIDFVLTDGSKANIKVRSAD
ncbi:MAG: hypothetical protein ACXWRE_13510 [Pseudobdellovibrionaceae bacterium]